VVMGNTIDTLAPTGALQNRHLAVNCGSCIVNESIRFPGPEQLWPSTV
jgi:hypothetical protein